VANGSALEPFKLKWKRFDGEDFSCRQGEYRSAMPASCEDFDTADAEKSAKPIAGKCMKYMEKPQSFQLGSLRPGQRRVQLTVITPLRRPLHAGTQITGAQPIPFQFERL